MLVDGTPCVAERAAAAGIVPTTSLTMSQSGMLLRQARPAGLDTEDHPDHVVGD